MSDVDTPVTAGAEQGRPRPPRRGYLIPGLIALAVLAALAVVIDVLGQQHTTPRSLAGPDVATLIAQGMQAQTGSHQPPQIRCPTTEPVRAGLDFDCTLERGGAVRTVRVHETSAQGQFTWKVLGAAAPG